MTNSKFSIIALATIAVVGVAVFSVLEVQNETSKSGGNKIIVDNSFTTTKLEELNKISQDVVQGTIISKSHIIQYRDVDGNYVDKDSKAVAEKEPYIVYELKALKKFKTIDGKKQIYTFKTLGGEVGGYTVQTSVPELRIGDEVLILLHEAFDGQYQEIAAEEYGIYKYKNNEFIGKDQTLTEAQLLQKLQ